MGQGLSVGRAGSVGGAGRKCWGRQELLGQAGGADGGGGVSGAGRRCQWDRSCW